MADLDHWATRICGDAAFAFACRGLNVALSLRCDGAQVDVLMSDPVARCERPYATRPGIVISLTGDALRAILQSEPPPGLQSFGAWLRHDVGITVETDPLTQAQALAALERMSELARPGDVAFDGYDYAHDAGAVRGHRREMTVQSGRRALIHWLEAGRDIASAAPILMLHTAGADARQYMHQLADTALGARHALFAFDMPWHGQSTGEDGCETTHAYRLGEASYLEWCVAFIEQVIAGPVIVMGCSAGAAMALTLTARRPDLVAGCIALEAPLRAPGRRSELLADARVANGMHNPAYVRALLGPRSPQCFRDEAAAIYAQGRPGVYMGDLAYYSDDFDGAALAPALTRCARPIQLLTGAYDYSASPANTRALWKLIGHEAAQFTLMEGLGHFPMIENPPAFRPYLLDALDKIQEQRQ